MKLFIFLLAVQLSTQAFSQTDSLPKKRIYLNDSAKLGLYRIDDRYVFRQRTLGHSVLKGALIAGGTGTIFGVLLGRLTGSDGRLITTLENGGLGFLVGAPIGAGFGVLNFYLNRLIHHRSPS